MFLLKQKVSVELFRQLHESFQEEKYQKIGALKIAILLFQYFEVLQYHKSVLKICWLFLENKELKRDKYVRE